MGLSSVAVAVTVQCNMISARFGGWFLYAFCHVSLDHKFISELFHVNLSCKCYDIGDWV